MKPTLLAAAVLLATVFPVAARASERGTLKNATKLTLYYKAGFADARGNVAWKSYKLPPGHAHTWTVRDPKRHPLLLQWDFTLGDGKFVPTGCVLPTRVNGFRSAFFRYGNQIWIDTSGGAK